MTDWLAVAISATALVVSGTTAWLTLFRRGQLRMTQPTVVFLGPEESLLGGKVARMKVYLRALLYSTSRKGQTIESMHVSVQRGESKQNFSIWVHGEDRLTRGSGLYVGTDGVACNHHFLLPEDGADFRLLPGLYLIRVFAKRVTDRAPHQLTEFALPISRSDASELEKEHAGIYFDWGPDQQAYHPHVEVREPALLPPPQLFDAASWPTRVGEASTSLRSSQERDNE